MVHYEDYSDDCDDDYADSFSDGDEYDVSFSAKVKKQPIHSATNNPKSKDQSKDVKQPMQQKKNHQRAAKPASGSIKPAPTWISLAGHVDSGKSTLTARILRLADSPDVTPEEQRHGITMELMMKRMEGFVFIDAPGHSDLLEVTSKAASLASIIIVVIDPTPGEFERGLGAQTEEHLRAISILAPLPLHLVFAINKMDKLSWDMLRFHTVAEILSSLVEQIWRESVFSTPPATIQCVPLSAITGDNVFDLDISNLSIADGNGATANTNDHFLTLWEAISKTSRAQSQTETPKSIGSAFLLSVLHTTSAAGSNSFVLEGRVAHGTIALASAGCMSVRIYPGAHLAKLSKLALADNEVHSPLPATVRSTSPTKSSISSAKYIETGEFVSFSLDADPSLVATSTSLIVSQSFQWPVREERIFDGKISLLPLKKHADFIVVPGSTFIALISSIAGMRSMPCEIMAINPTAPSLRAPRFLRPGARGCVRLRFDFAILCAPPFPQIKFLLLHHGKSVATGVADAPVSTA